MVTATAIVAGKNDEFCVTVGPVNMTVGKLNDQKLAVCAAIGPTWNVC